MERALRGVAQNHWLVFVDADAGYRDAADGTQDAAAEHGQSDTRPETENCIGVAFCK